jgi:hypothetical protein
MAAVRHSPELRLAAPPTYEVPSLMHVPLLRRRLLPLALLLTFALTASPAQATCTDGSSCTTAHAAAKKHRPAKKQRAAKKPRRSKHRNADRTRHARGPEAKQRRRKTTTRPKKPASHRPAPGVPTPPAVPGAPAPSSRPSAPRTPTIPATPGSGRSTRLFADSSIWNRPLGSTAQLDPTSADRMQALTAEIDREKQAGNGPWINDVHYSTPVYRVSASQRRVPVKIDNGSWADSLRRALARGVPIPDDAKPAWGSDGHMVVYQASTDTLWEFWRASKQADGWHAVWGGVMEHVSDNPGYYDNTAVSGLGADEGWGWGATATSLSVAGGLITIDDLRSGEIDHALAIGVPTACAGTFAWPAQRTDGKLSTADCLPEGAHLRLDPTLNIDAMSLPTMTRMMAKAAQKYGIYVRDVTYSVVTFVAEDPTPTGSNPYTGPDGLYGGVAPWKFVPAFPWSSLQLTKMSLCTKAPCRQTASALSASSKHTKRKRGKHRRHASHRRR